jgi:hypothetical protein
MDTCDAVMSAGMTVDEDETLAGRQPQRGKYSGVDSVQAGSRSLPTSRTQHEALRTEEPSEIRCPISVS